MNDLQLPTMPDPNDYRTPDGTFASYRHDAALGAWKDVCNKLIDARYPPAPVVSGSVLENLGVLKKS